ncbi:translocation/assembly module TamB domain-containing protein [uncultured Hymenobacter sp.]|uniref:translocation/assembly module TamB domain-containing protein n=1 Tax=uncultured Hymenobacter sp. TaxID=170016 RepID=UPI0035CC2B65
MRRLLYGVLGLLALVLLLVVVAVVALQFPATQDFIARKGESYLRDKLKTEVRIGRFRTDFRHAINLDNVYLADQQRDTLLAVGHLGVSIDIWKLAQSQINISDVELNDGRVRLTRTAPDSVNNYDFIINAFSDPTAPVDTTTSSLRYNIGKARLTNIYFTQDDQIAGSDLRARLGELAVTMDEVDVDKSIYKVDNATLRRASIAMVQTKTAPELDDNKPTEPLTLQFGLNRATLETVAFTYKNTPAAQFINTRIGQAEVTARNIDLPNARVDLTKLTLKNTSFAYSQNENVPVAQRVVNPAEAVRTLNESARKAKAATSAEPLRWRVTLAQSDISGVDVAFDNFDEPRQKTRLPALDYNHLKFTDLILNTHNFSFSGNRTTAQVDNLAGREQSGFRIDKWQANVVYDSVQIRLDSLDLITPHTRIRRTLAIGFQDLATLAEDRNLPNLKLEGDLRNVRLGFRDILYLAPDLISTPPFTTGANQSILLSGQIAGRLGDFQVRNLEFVGLRNTQLLASGRIRGLPNTDNRLVADLNICRFNTTEADLRSVLPPGTIPKATRIGSVALSGRVQGSLGDFRVQNLNFRGLGNTQLAASGRIRGLPNVDERLFADLNIARFSTTAADLRGVLPPGTLPAGYQLPAVLSVNGTFSGQPTALRFNTNLRLASSFGNAAANVRMAPGPKGQEPVTGTFAVQNFNVGKLIGDPTIGRVTATGQLNARGLTPESMRGQLAATVQSAQYNGYTYRNVQATVGIDRQRYDIKASSAGDPNLNLDLAAVVNLRDAKNPSYELTSLNVRGANLTALGFYTGGDLRVQGDLNANFAGADLNSLNGTFSGSRVVIVRDNQPFAFDSLSGRITQTADRATVAFNSTLLAANLDGNVHLGDLAPELQQHIDRYFDLPGVRYVASSANRRFTYSLKLKDTRLATKLVPGLTRISPFTLAGDYDRQAARLTAKTDIRIIRYQNYRLDSLRLDVNSDPRKLDYALRLAQAAQDTTLRLRQPSVIGNVADNKIFARAAILGDSLDRERLALAGTLSVVNQRQASAYEFVAAAEQIINYENWSAGTNNFVRYNPDGSIVANNLRLTNGRSTLAVQSQDPQANNSPLLVRFEQFDLAELARAVEQQDSLIAGTLNGQAELRGLGTKQQALTANLTISQLIFQKALIGDLALQARNPVANRYDIEARLTGGGVSTAGGPTPPGNDVRATGSYTAAGNNPLQFRVEVGRLNLKTAEPFSAGQLSQTAGFLSGTLAVAGTAAAPQIRGTLTTSSDAAFIVPQLGAPFRLPNQRLTFDERGLAFRDFTVLDSAGNRAVANGYLLTRNFIDYNFDLRATTNNFLAVRSTRKNNPLYYGRLVLDSDTRLTGPLTLIKVDTDVTVARGSDLTVESPTGDPSAVEREGIVKFIDKSAPLDTALARQLALDTVRTGTTGYDITARVKITQQTPFTLIIDPASGDNLRVRANGQLTTTIDPSGAITLDGTLAVARGSYRLSLYGLTSREFTIRRGSSLTWTGDPYNADLNLTAIYKVKAAPAELLAGQGSDNTETQSLARNTLPFNVLINVTGQLAKPTIGFDITLPEDQRTPLYGEIDAKLGQLRQPNQTSEQSKQVFSLLVLGRFVQQNPFQTSAGESFVASQLRGSVSSVLTDQLNNLTGKYLAGLGIDLGVTNQAVYGADGGTGSRTDLNVAVRRQLLNNRLTVRLGTDVPLAGGSGGSGTQATQGANAASNFAGDVSLEYTLLRDGRLRLRAFRQNAYEDIDGPIVRTGASLVYQREYNNLAQLFEKVSENVKERRREARKEEKQDQKQQDQQDQQAQDSASTVMLPLRRDTLSRTARPAPAAGKKN